jgi:hypothetical protein
MVNKQRIVRWRDWEGEGIEHLVLTEKPSLIVAEGTVLGEAERGGSLRTIEWSVTRAGLSERLRSLSPAMTARWCLPVMVRAAGVTAQWRDRY